MTYYPAQGPNKSSVLKSALIEALVDHIAQQIFVQRLDVLKCEATCILKNANNARLHLICFP